MNTVWVVRNRHGDIVYFAACLPTEKIDGWTVTRETLLTPAQAAVVEAAKAIRDVPFTYQFGSEHWIQAFDKLDIAVTALRALEGDA
jgi:hypothetical protein